MAGPRSSRPYPNVSRHISCKGESDVRRWIDELVCRLYGLGGDTREIRIVGGMSLDRYSFLVLWGKRAPFIRNNRLGASDGD